MIFSYLSWRKSKIYIISNTSASYFFSSTLFCHAFYKRVLLALRHPAIAYLRLIHYTTDHLTKTSNVKVYEQNYINNANLSSVTPPNKNLLPERFRFYTNFLKAYLASSHKIVFYDYMNWKMVVAFASILLLK